MLSRAAKVDFSGDLPLMNTGFYFNAQPLNVGCFSGETCFPGETVMRWAEGKPNLILLEKNCWSAKKRKKHQAV